MIIWRDHLFMSMMKMGILVKNTMKYDNDGDGVVDEVVVESTYTTKMVLSELTIQKM